MSEFSYSIRKLTPDDVPQALDVWRETGFEEGTHSLYTWLQCDKNCFYIAVIDTGEVIGTCSAVIHHENLAFFGFYAVRKNYRGLGIGKKLWDHCFKRVGRRNAVVNSVPEMVEKYREHGGFPIVETEWRVVTFRTRNRVTPKALTDDCPEGVEILPFNESLIPAMTEYDFALTGYKRNVAIELTCKEEGSRTFVAFKENLCVGFGTIKTTCSGMGYVGPLYADRPKVAEALLKKLIISLPNARGLMLHSDSSNEFTKGFMQKINCTRSGESPHMYSKKKIDLVPNKVFAHFNPNLFPY